jgi:hypothetical protein
MLGFGIRESTTTTGTGNLTIAAVTGYPRFSDVPEFAHTVGRRFHYSILDSGNLPLESGIGYLTTDANTLVRESVRATYVSSTYDNTAPSAASLAAGTKYVICSAADAISAFGYTGNAAAKGFSPLTYGGDQNVSLTAANTLSTFPIWVPERIECTGMYANLSVTAAAGKVFRMGLYSAASNGTLGKVLMDSGSIAADSSGAKNYTLSTNIILHPGIYFAAFNCDATCQFTGTTGLNNGFMGYSTGSPARAIVRGYVGSVTYAAFADNPGAWVEERNSQNYIFVWVKAA